MRPKSAFGVILVIIGLIGLYYVFTNEGKSPLEAMKHYFTNEVYEQQTIKLDGIENIVVDSDSLDVSFVRGSGSEAVLTLNGRASKSYIKHLDMNAEQDDDTLHITLENKTDFQFGINYSDVKLTVELPEHSRIHAWNTLDVNVSSGDVILENQLFAAAKIHSSSGDIEAKSFKVTGELTVETGSGDVELDDIDADSINLKLNSGDIEVKHYTAELIEFHVGSGDVSFEDGSARLTGRTSAGDISLQADDLLQNTELTTGSGDVTVNLDRDPSSLEIHFTTGSGDGAIRKSGFIYDEVSNDEDNLRGAFGDGDVKLSVATSSGDFVLK